MICDIVRIYVGLVHLAIVSSISSTNKSRVEQGGFVITTAERLCCKTHGFGCKARLLLLLLLLLRMRALRGVVLPAEQTSGDWAAADGEAGPASAAAAVAK